MTFSQASGQAHLWSDIPPQEEAFGQFDISSGFGQADLWLDIPLRVRLWVRLTFSQTSGQADLCFFLSHSMSDL